MSDRTSIIAGAVLAPFVGLPTLAFFQAPSAQELGAFMISAASLMVIIRQGLALVREMKEGFSEKPRPADTYQTKAAAKEAAAAQTTSCQLTHQALNKLLDERKSRADEDRKEMRDSIEGLSKRIDLVLKMIPDAMLQRVKA